MQANHEDSELVEKGPCDNCDAWKGKCTYSDGHTYCFACANWTPPSDQQSSFSPMAAKKAQPFDLASLKETSDVKALSKWGITQRTCKHWDYRVRINEKGEGEHIAIYKDDKGLPVYAKIRNTGKDGTEKNFYSQGDESAVSLWGIERLGKGGKMVVVLEGEKDTLCASQLWSNKFPVVGLPFGAGSSSKAFAKALDKLSRYDKVVLALDMDDPGQQGSLELAKMLPPGKAHQAQLSSKDVHQMFMDEGPEKVISCIHNAPPYRPDGVIDAKDLWGLALAPVVSGASWPYEFMTEWTYGLRPGEVVVIGAGTGIGKSDFQAEIAAHLIKPKKDGGAYERCAVFNYEASPVATLKGIAGKIAEKRFHIPLDPENPDGDYWKQEELEAAREYMTKECASLFINDHFGAVDWQSVKERTRFLKHTEGVTKVFIDPVAALVAQEEDERKALDLLFAEAKSISEELGVNMIFNSHLSRPLGKSHEEGGRVELRNFRGSGGITMWASFVFGMERNQQAEEEEERATATIRVLKDRFTGDSTGKTQKLIYNALSGRYEVPVYKLDDQEQQETPEEPPE